MHFHSVPKFLYVHGLYHIDVYDMVYNGVDTMYENLGKSCQYGSLYIIYGGDSSYGRAESNLTYYAQLCSNTHNAKYKIHGHIRLLLIPYNYYSKFKV